MAAPLWKSSCVTKGTNTATLEVVRLRLSLIHIFLHAGNPEPLHRFRAAGHLVDETENQFSLPACVGRGGHAVHVRAVEQSADDFKLLFLFVRDNELPRLGLDGQILIPPLTVFFIVLARLCLLYTSGAGLLGFWCLFLGLDCGGKVCQRNLFPGLCFGLQLAQRWCIVQHTCLLYTSPETTARRRKCPWPVCGVPAWRTWL